jgi:hypothetical protein
MDPPKFNRKLPPISEAKSTSINMNQIVKNSNNDTCFIKPTGERRSLIFNTQISYSYQEVLDLLSKLDNLWEESTSKQDNTTYFS